MDNVWNFLKDKLQVEKTEILIGSNSAINLTYMTVKIKRAINLEKIDYNLMTADSTTKGSPWTF